MSSSMYARVHNDPALDGLVRKRTRFACLLSAAVLVAAAAH
ncbi:MAG TPA: hypothetical protein VFR86_25745 [Burkholderiaceae bacterium]|nr:hypothetical protein [Burkholderiaceae bacterium]